MDGGEIGAGHDVTALYEVQLAADTPSDLQLGDVTLRWESAETGDIRRADQRPRSGRADRGTRRRVHARGHCGRLRPAAQADGTGERPTA
ncbi:MAG: DUF3520 domain-containing protein [Nocardioidaceae bacterium]|nr:DUF3520 domain-containing protein [Nocardioidaceae bacterium]